MLNDNNCESVDIMSTPYEGFYCISTLTKTFLQAFLYMQKKLKASLIFISHIPIIVQNLLSA